MKTPTTPKKASCPSDWHPADIVAAIHKRGLSLRKLAAQCGVSQTTASRALRRRTEAGEQRIARALGLHPMVIWPSRYHPDGSRIEALRGQPSHRSKSKATTVGGHVNGNTGRGR